MMELLAMVSSTSNSGVAGTDTKIQTISTAGGPWKRASGTPSVLAQAAGLSLDTYTLARCVASEFGSGPAIALFGIAEAIRNHSTRRGTTIFAALTASSARPESAGLFGEQSGRYASTLRDPSPRHVAVARSAIEDRTSFVGPAVKFFDPRVQDGGYQADRKLTKDAAQVVESWSSDGYEWIGPVDGINPYNLMLFRPSGDPQTAAALHEIALGRSGRKDQKGFPWPVVMNIAALATGVGGLLARSYR